MYRPKDKNYSYITVSIPADDPNLHKALKMLAVRRETTVGHLVLEAIQTAHGEALAAEGTQLSAS